MGEFFGIKPPEKKVNFVQASVMPLHISDDAPYSTSSVHIYATEHLATKIKQSSSWYQTVTV
jgi:hypothetical protein